MSDFAQNSDGKITVSMTVYVSVCYRHDLQSAAIS